MRIGIIILFLIISMWVLVGCTSMSEIPSCCWIAPPDIHLTGQKTAIERQIVGDFREIEKEAWIVSSVQTGISPGKLQRDEEMFNAFKVRNELAAEIRRLKDEGAIGEANSGYLAYIGTAEYENDTTRKKALQSIIAKENDARKIIFTRSLVRAGIANPTVEQINAFGKKFAEEQRAFAKENDWIQEAGGRWIRKK
ncbi:MAG: YdbL family protein [Spirochaetes bacterium]|nr:YdbL family protein [Spirochaetota bacterium]